MEISKKAYNNAILNLQECRDRAPILTSYPLKLYIEPSSFCNLNCSYCYPANMRLNKNIDMDIFHALKQQLFDTACEVNLFLTGEPTLHPKFHEMLDICSGYPFVTKFFTNLSYRNDSLLRKMVEAGTWVNVSFDGIGENRFRDGLNEDKVIQNIKTLLEYKREIKNKKFYLRIATVVGKHNVNSLTALINWVSQIRIPEIMLGCLDVNKELEQYRLTAEDAKAFDKAIRQADILGIRISTPSHIGGVKLERTHNWDDFSIGIDKYFPHFCEDCNPDAESKFCPYPWIQALIDSTGDVVSCCQRKLYIGKFTPEVNFIKDIWNSDNYQKLRSLKNFSTCGEEICKPCNMIHYSIWGGENRLKHIPKYID